MTENEKVDAARAILDSISNEMQRDIDFTIIYENLGWYMITVTPRSVSNLIELLTWANEYCGNYKCHGFKFVFESEKDASMFALKWC